MIPARSPALHALTPRPALHALTPSTPSHPALHALTPRPAPLLPLAYEYIAQLQRRVRLLEGTYDLPLTVPPSSPPAFSDIITPLSTPIQRPQPSTLGADMNSFDGGSSPLGGV